MARFYLHLLLYLLFALPPATFSATFNFSDFDGSSGSICLQGDATVIDGEIWVAVDKHHSVGRAYYSDPVVLWDDTTGELTNFTTHFSFVIHSPGSPTYSGGGLTFFLSSHPSLKLPLNSTDGQLGLFPADGAKERIVAVEFDSHRDEAWDPSQGEEKNSTDHIGIDVNSVYSKKTIPWDGDIEKGKEWKARVSYVSNTRDLTVWLVSAGGDVLPTENYTLSYNVDLRDFLPEKVVVGFSASTGGSKQLHKILSWDFSSSLVPPVTGGGSTAVRLLVVGVSVGGTAVVVVLIGGVFVTMRRRAERSRKGVKLPHAVEVADGSPNSKPPARGNLKR